MRAFLARQADDARYRYLIGARRFASRATYVAGTRELYDGESFEPPNARLSAILATLNARSIVGALADQAAFLPLRYVLLAAAGGDCGALTSFLPASLRGPVTQTMATYEQASAAAGSGQEAAKRLRRASTTNGYRSGVAASDPVALRFIAERLAGLPQQRWSLALESNTYDLAAPDTALSLEHLLFERLADSEPEMRDLRAFRSFTATDPYCAERRRRSERELSALYGAASWERSSTAITPAATGAARQAQLLDRCDGCHGEAGPGPALPFRDPVELGRRLAAGGYAHGRLLDEVLYRLTPQAAAARMPRGVNLTPAEQHELEDYFVGLAGGMVTQGQPGGMPRP